MLTVGGQFTSEASLSSATHTMDEHETEAETESVVEFLESTRRQFLQATGGLSAAAFAGTAAAAKGDDNSGNGESGFSKRVEKLLSELSLEEKVGQMTQIEITALDPETEYEQSDAVETIGDLFTDYGVGSLLSGGATAPDYDPEKVQEGLNDLQEFAIENTDSGNTVRLRARRRSRERYRRRRYCLPAQPRTWGDAGFGADRGGRSSHRRVGRGRRRTLELLPRGGPPARPALGSVLRGVQ